MAPGIALDAQTPEGHPVRGNGVEPQAQVPTNGLDPDDIFIPDQLYGSKRKIRIGFIGAGLSALSFFKFAEEKLENVDIVSFEKNHDIGGTWLENRYEGCACDIPSVVYQFPWRPAKWSKYYSSSPEIWRYAKMVADENNFTEKYVKLRHKVIRAEWKDEAGFWTIKVQNLATGEEFEDKFDVILDGSGVLNKWKWPNIKGLHDFKGTLMHTARWDEGMDLTGKRVALIGAGSSGVQVLSQIYSKVAEVYTWVRSPIWVTAGFAQRFASENGDNFTYSEEQQKVMDDPVKYLAYRKMIEGELNQRFPFIINGSKEAEEARVFSEKEMRAKMAAKPDLCEKIMPKDFGVGCRRPTPGHGYLEALVGEKTTCYTDNLQRITPKGFVDHEGVEHEVDVIVCATGFDTSFIPIFPLIINGKNMNEYWAGLDSMPSYLSVALSGVPNYFTFAGAYGPLAHGSFFPLIAQYSDYIIKCITKIQIENIKSVRPKKEAVQHFLRHAKRYLQRTAWAGPCSSWFKQGKIHGTPAVFPASRLVFLKLLENPRFEDYDYRYLYKDDIFSFLGNGFAKLEQDGSDITWYLGRLEEKVDEEELEKQMAGVADSVLKQKNNQKGANVVIG